MRAFALIEHGAQHARETAAHRRNDSAQRIAAELPVDELVQLLDACYEDGLVRLFDSGQGNLLSGGGCRNRGPIGASPRATGLRAVSTVAGRGKQLRIGVNPFP